MRIEDRFWTKVDVRGPNDHWLWTAAAFKTGGYGRFRMNGRDERAHRVAFWLTAGHWPTPYCLHVCDIPLCCNPAHLFEGTQLENIRDRTLKGRSARGEKNGMARLTDKQVAEIRRLYAAGGISYRQLAHRFGVPDKSLIGLIVNHRTRA